MPRTDSLTWRPTWNAIELEFHKTRMTCINRGVSRLGSLSLSLALALALALALKVSLSSRPTPPLLSQQQLLQLAFIISYYQ